MKSSLFTIFIGYDERQAASYHVCVQSIIENSSIPVSITPLVLNTLPIKRKGLTPFSFSRFLVPWLMNYKGWSLFCDPDMLFQKDISSLLDFKDDNKAILIPNVNTPFERAAFMLFNNEKCQQLTPDFVEASNELHTLKFLNADEIGYFDHYWNFLVGYDEDPESENLVNCFHYTQGIPLWPQTQYCPYAHQWFACLKRIAHPEPWETLMGNSVHAITIDYKGKKVPLPRYFFTLTKNKEAIVHPQYDKIIRSLINTL